MGVDGELDQGGSHEKDKDGPAAYPLPQPDLSDLARGDQVQGSNDHDQHPGDLDLDCQRGSCGERVQPQVLAVLRPDPLRREEHRQCEEKPKRSVE